MDPPSIKSNRWTYRVFVIDARRDSIRLDSHSAMAGGRLHFRGTSGRCMYLFHVTVRYMCSKRDRSWTQVDGHALQLKMS